VLNLSEFEAKVKSYVSTDNSRISNSNKAAVNSYSHISSVKDKAPVVKTRRVSQVKSTSDRKIIANLTPGSSTSGSSTPSKYSNYIKVEDFSR